jgi:hypothetical protein
MMGKLHWQDIAKWAWNVWQIIHTSLTLNTWWQVLAWGDKEPPVEEEGSNNEEEDDEEMEFMDAAT